MQRKRQSSTSLARQRRSAVKQWNNVSTHPLEIRRTVSRIVAASIAYLCAFTASHCRREVRTAKKLNATPQENNNPNLQGVDGVFYPALIARVDHMNLIGGLSPDTLHNNVCSLLSLQVKGIITLGFIAQHFLVG